MKQLKRGFSLAELLIAIAIVSIIATMGFTISKKGIEKAYNLYVYTGYIGLCDAMGYAESEGGGSSITTAGNTINPDYMEKVQSALDVRNAGNGTEFTAPNGITYEFEFLGNYSIVINDEQVNFRRIGIRMTVPTRKGNEGRTYTFAYMPDEPYRLLIPNPNEELQNRVDLLPFYVDDGLTGRVVVDAGGSTYHPREYLSAREALCSVYSGVDVYTNEENGPVNIEHEINADANVGSINIPSPVVNCNGVVHQGDHHGATLKVANPRRL